MLYYIIVLLTLRKRRLVPCPKNIRLKTELKHEWYIFLIIAVVFLLGVVDLSNPSGTDRHPLEYRRRAGRLREPLLRGFGLPLITLGFLSSASFYPSDRPPPPELPPLHQSLSLD